MGPHLDLQSYGVGQPVRRVEDACFLIGRGRFIDDIELPHQAHARVVLSPHAHARIKRIDTAAARNAPGVLCVLTGDDVRADRLGGLSPNFMPEDVGGPKGLRTRRPILVSDRVRCVGDRVGLVVAETHELARDASELLVIDYEPLPAVANIEDAVNLARPWSGSVRATCRSRWRTATKRRPPRHSLRRRTYRTGMQG
jgi:carbon-monoxide dehydrogenase large subunit